MGGEVKGKQENGVGN